MSLYTCILRRHDVGVFHNDSQHRVVKWFWEILQSFDLEDRAKLLQFVTGTSGTSTCLLLTRIMCLYIYISVYFTQLFIGDYEYACVGVPVQGFGFLQGNDGNIRKFTLHGDSNVQVTISATTVSNYTHLSVNYANRCFLELIRVLIVSICRYTKLKLKCRNI